MWYKEEVRQPLTSCDLYLQSLCFGLVLPQYRAMDLVNSTRFGFWKCWSKASVHDILESVIKDLTSSKRWILVSTHHQLLDLSLKIGSRDASARRSGSPVRQTLLKTKPCLERKIWIIDSGARWPEFMSLPYHLLHLWPLLLCLTFLGLSDLIPKKWTQTQGFVRI